MGWLKWIRIYRLLNILLLRVYIFNILSHGEVDEEEVDVREEDEEDEEHDWHNRLYDK